MFLFHLNSVLVGNALNGSCTDLSNLECGPLIQDILNSYTRNGIMLTVPSIVSGGGTSKSANRSRSFYSGFDYNPSAEDLCKAGLDKFGNRIPPLKPTLKIYYTTSKDTCVKLCRPNIDSSSVNPYIWGILGNWRMNRTYNYYGRRKESDPNPAILTNTRTDEQIQSFVPYWAFNSANLIASADSSRWVWNSEITQFNRKGMEIENKDPLQRYNCGQYGYNQSIPVAVTQNSRSRNAAFDGFEDYDYKTNSCNALCASARFIDFVSAGGIKDSLIRHTGRFSLKLSGNQTTNTIIPVASAIQDSLPAMLSIKTDSIINTVNKVVTGKGTGLLTTYGVFNSSNNCGGGPFPTEISNVNKNWGLGGPLQICVSDRFTAQWTGFIQPCFNDYYTFTSIFNDGIQVLIDGVPVISAMTTSLFDQDRIRNSAPVYLQQGKLHTITVSYFENKGKASAQLWWASNNQVKEIIPSSQLYIPSMVPADSAGSIVTTVTYCVKLNNPKPINNTLKTFSPISGTKMIISAWVKENQPCINGTYNASSIDVSFIGSGLTFQFRPKGNIIEGWQRIEDTLSIPLAATAITIKLRSLSSVEANFDDIRLHPFNALMKSYVYDPVSLRLMAELDENNFASFYEYDDDGTLSRIKKETERGIKTIQETRSALLKDQ